MKAKKSPKIEYGIEVTKPHSKEMYNHNDKVSEMMKIHISHSMSKAWSQACNDNDRELFDKLVKAICWSGFGDGFSLSDIKDEFENELVNFPNWQLDQEWDDMVAEGLVPKLIDVEGRKIGLIGFNQ